jgi:hypothetical protein
MTLENCQADVIDDLVDDEVAKTPVRHQPRRSVTPPDFSKLTNKIFNSQSLQSLSLYSNSGGRVNSRHWRGVVDCKPNRIKSSSDINTAGVNFTQFNAVSINLASSDEDFSAAHIKPKDGTSKEKNQPDLTEKQKCEKDESGEEDKELAEKTIESSSNNNLETSTTSSKSSSCSTSETSSSKLNSNIEIMLMRRAREHYDNASTLNGGDFISLMSDKRNFSSAATSNTDVSCLYFLNF